MPDVVLTADMEDIRSIPALVSYVTPGSRVNRRFVSPGAEVNTGSYESHEVLVRDGRRVKDSFNLDRNGFVLASYPSQVRDFFDRDEVDEVYPAEAVAAVRSLTGADLVAPLGWMVRTSGDLSKHRHQTTGYTHRGGVQPPAGEAHVDMTPDRARRMAAEVFEREFTGARPYRRFIASSLWRCFSDGPQDWPIAVCDGGSVADDEGTPNTMFIVDQLPGEEEMLRAIPGEETAMAADIFHYNPAHRWWYFSDMRRDEVLLFKFHDSDHSVAWRVPHTAFHDTSLPAARTRESIEFRTLAYFL